MATLKEKLERTKNRIGLVGTRLNLLHPETGRGITEYITHDWNEIVISIRKGLNLVPDAETQEYCKKLGIQSPLETLATDLLFHGCGHRELPTETGKGCPHENSYHDQILNGIARALKEKKKQGLESYFANAFEDIIDNVNARQHTRLAGKILFWNQEALENQGKFSQFYEAFVKLNLSLWGSAADMTLLHRWCSNSKEVQAAVHSYKSYLKQQLHASSLLRSHDHPERISRIFAKEKWEDWAYQFALTMADLESSSSFRLCTGMQHESPFDQEMHMPDVREQLAHGRYINDKQPSVHQDPISQRDALYRSLAKAIPVTTEEYVKASGFPLVRFGRKDILPEDISESSRVRGIRFDPEGNPVFRTTRHSLEFPVTYKSRPRNLPKLKIVVLDASASMQLPPSGTDAGSKQFIPWGDNSKYHYALLGLYGIESFLEQQGVADEVQSSVIVFGETTKKTSRGKLGNEQERRAILRMPDGKQTVLDVEKLDDKVKSFLLTISDGCIDNWGAIKEKFREIVKQHEYAHIQIGPANEFTRDLKRWGCQVHYVHGGEDLSRIMIDTVADRYKKGDIQDGK